MPVSRLIINSPVSTPGALNFSVLKVCFCTDVAFWVGAVLVIQADSIAAAERTASTLIY